jgi:hypothetical protein
MTALLLVMSHLACVCISAVGVFALLRMGWSK